MAVPWQTDTASCRAGYPGTEFPPDNYIPTFWPSRVPNTVLTEEDYQTVIDTSLPIERRMAAFYHRPNWLRSLGLNKPYVEQITKMITTFGDLGIMEKRAGATDGEFPAVMFIETLHEKVKPMLKAMPAAPSDAPAPEQQPSVSEEFAQARFGGLRRRR
jgi:hypothetical protein